MQKKFGLEISIIIVLILVITSVVSALNINPIITTNQLNFNPLDVTTDPYPQLDVSKQVWNGSAWVDECIVANGTIVRFNISVIYHDIDAQDGCNQISQIQIIDNLSDFEYIGNPWISENGKNPDDYLHFDSITNIYEWKFYGQITLSELLSSFNSTLHLEFDAKVNHSGSNRNYVEVNGTESCCGRYAYGDADAFVNVSEPENPAVALTKYVKENTDWVKSTSVSIGDTVSFKLFINNTGNVALTNVNVTDDLPVFLSFNNDANITPASFSTHHIEWSLGTLAVDQRIEIVFSADATVSGEADNSASVTSDEGPADDDTAHIIVLPQGDLHCTKTVWDPDTQEWVEEINAEIGDTVRFNITLTYTGDGTFSNIHVTDMLPVCLQYANNANPVETAISNNKVFWNLSDILTDGQSISIEFDALVISSGTNINTVNITGYENCIELLYCEDTATIIVAELPPPDLQCEKTVWDPDTQEWVEEINAEVGDTVRFKITVFYWGSLAFYNIWINDTLPTCLQYANNAIPYQPVNINGKEVTWYLAIFLRYGQNISLEFDALVISDGENINTVNITGIECGIRQLFCEDTATVLVEKQPDPLIADAGGPYTGYVSEPIQLTGSATGGVPSYTYTWDLNNDGVYDDGVGVNPTYSWGAPATYTIRLKVTDTTGTNDTDTAQVTVNERNTPPNTPSTPDGPASGKTKRELTYSSSAVDPNGNNVYLLFDWGDGNTSGWLGPINSGTSYEATHIWTVKGTYSIKVKAKDTHGAESTWSDPFTITITKSISLQPLFEILMDRFPALANLLTALLNILETIQLNHASLAAV